MKDMKRALLRSSWYLLLASVSYLIVYVHSNSIDCPVGLLELIAFMRIVLKATAMAVLLGWCIYFMAGNSIDSLSDEHNENPD